MWLKQFFCNHNMPYCFIMLPWINLTIIFLKNLKKCSDNTKNTTLKLYFIYFVYCIFCIPPG